MGVMANKDGRESLRGAEEETLDLISQVLTPQMWGELLKALLQLAAGKGKLGLAQKLVGAGAEIGDALHEAIRGSHSDVASYLLESGASVSTKNTMGLSPLHVAAGRRETAILQHLLLKGADKDALDEDGWTPLFTAASHDNLSAALGLLAAGADVSLQSRHSKKSVVHLAAEKNVTLLRVIIRHGADVEAADVDDNTALHFAACFNRAEAIDVLVEAGANIEALRCDGSTPLHLASHEHHLEAVIALLKHGAKVNARDTTNNTPLRDAASRAGREGATEVVDLLLRSGADETLVDANGQTAADVIGDAIEEGDFLTEDVEQVLRLLTNAPADRAWRRRGYLVLCRAHPERVRRHVGMVTRAGNRCKLAKTETSTCGSGWVGCSMADERDSGGWAGLVGKVLGLQEDGVFRTIVGYL